MNRLKQVTLARSLRRGRVRAKIHGSSDRPRLSVSISNTHINAQVIDDDKGHTLVAATTVGTKTTGNLSQKAAVVGADIAAKLHKAKIKKIVFDRNERRYAGRLKALLDVVRQEGIEV